MPEWFIRILVGILIMATSLTAWVLRQAYKDHRAILDASVLGCAVFDGIRSGSLDSIESSASLVCRVFEIVDGFACVGVDWIGMA